MLLPDTLRERLESFLPEDKKASIFQAFESIHPVSFRANTIKINAKELEKSLSKQGFLLDTVSWYTDAFILRNKSKENLMATDAYQQGFLYIQNLSSMIPPLILDPKKDDLVLDMTAAPGSKTTQLASLMHNQGILIANDKSPNRLFRMKAILANQGVTNTTMLSIPGEFLWKKYPEYFDKVLLDAPCSMEGRIALDEEETIREWSPKKVRELSNLQKWLLRSAISATRIGGTIVYSTCALSPEENEEVVDYILQKEKDSVTIETITIPQLQTSTGLLSWKYKVFDTSLVNTVRIYPDKLMEGFFIAKIKKTSSNVARK